MGNRLEKLVGRKKNEKKNLLVLELVLYLINISF